MTVKGIHQQFIVCVILGFLHLLGSAINQPPARAQSAEDTASTFETWIPFSTTSGGYYAEFPVQPDPKTSTSELLDTELTWQMQLAASKAETEEDLPEVYMVAYADLPKQMTYFNSQKDILDAAVTAVIEGIESQQLKDTLEVEEKAYNGLPTRVLTGEGLGQFVVAGLSITGDRLYLMLALDDDSESFLHFFQTLSFVP